MAPQNVCVIVPTLFLGWCWAGRTLWRRPAAAQRRSADNEQCPGSSVTDMPLYGIWSMHAVIVGAIYMQSWELAVYNVATLVYKMKSDIECFFKWTWLRGSWGVAYFNMPEPEQVNFKRLFKVRLARKWLLIYTAEPQTPNAQLCLHDSLVVFV